MEPLSPGLTLARQKSRCRYPLAMLPRNEHGTAVSCRTPSAREAITQAGTGPAALPGEYACSLTENSMLADPLASLFRWCQNYRSRGLFNEVSSVSYMHARLVMHLDLVHDSY